ncbi:hypothetical protein ABKV57_22780, partial [Enterobacter hormaechei]
MHSEIHDRSIAAGSAGRPIKSDAVGSAHSWMRLPVLDRDIPVEQNSQRSLCWLEAAKSLHACGLVVPSDIEGWNSPGKVVESALSRWF